MTDFGHLMFGMVARLTWLGRHLEWTYGGTGLENVTWVGDLGGGTGMLAYQRVGRPDLRARKFVFEKVHDYGGSINIEGDIAAYMVGINMKEWKEISDPADNVDFIYKGLETYFSKEIWTTRVNCFIAMLGGVIEKGELTNRDDVLSDLSKDIKDFAEFYITTRVADKKMDKLTLWKSFAYIESCAKEVAEIFLDGLLALRTHPNTTAFVPVTDPNPTKVEKSEIDEAIKTAKQKIEQIYKYIQKLK